MKIYSFYKNDNLYKIIYATSFMVIFVFDIYNLYCKCNNLYKMYGLGGLKNIKLFFPFWIHKPILDIYKCPKSKSSQKTPKNPLFFSGSDHNGLIFENISKNVVTVTFYVRFLQSDAENGKNGNRNKSIFKYKIHTR